jgi:hypothetical protein
MPQADAAGVAQGASFEGGSADDHDLHLPLHYQRRSLSSTTGIRHRRRGNIGPAAHDAGLHCLDSITHSEKLSEVCLPSISFDSRRAAAYPHPYLSRQDRVLSWPAPHSRNPHQ